MTKPVLVLGLGNSLAGDDGIGSRVADALARDARLPADVDVMQAGSDLLRLAPRMDGRTDVVLLDAMLTDGEVGAVSVLTDVCGVDMRQGHVHHLSAVQAMALLRTVVPRLDRVRCTWVAIGITDSRISHDLSPALEAALPGIVDTVLATLRSMTDTMDTA
jgi:hydrogenase maturation protease